MKSNFIEFADGVICHNSQVQSVNVYPYNCIIRNGTAFMDCDDMFLNEFGQDVREDIAAALSKIATKFCHEVINVPLLREIKAEFSVITANLRVKHPRYDMVIKRYEV